MLDGVKDLSFPWMYLLVVAAWCRGEVASAIRCMVVARLRGPWSFGLSAQYRRSCVEHSERRLTLEKSGAASSSRPRYGAELSYCSADLG